MHMSVNKFSMNNQPIIPFQYYMKDFDVTDTMWMHKHEYFEIMYVSYGRCIIETAKDENRSNPLSYILTQGQFIFLRPNIYHQLIMNEGDKANIFNIEFHYTDQNHEYIKNTSSIMTIDFIKLFNKTKLASLLSGEKGYFISSDVAQVGTAIKELILCCEKENKTSEDYLSLMLKESNLFVEIANCMQSKKLGGISYIRKANTYILENYTKKISINDIAKHVNISKSYLEHQYKKHTGQSILSFVNLLRVQRAEKLLSNTTKQISEIATLVGYKDKNQLNYEFKKKIGMSPREYRKTKKNDIDYSNENWTSSAIDPNTLL